MLATAMVTAETRFPQLREYQAVSGASKVSEGHGRLGHCEEEEEERYCGAGDEQNFA